MRLGALGHLTGFPVSIGVVYLPVFFFFVVPSYLSKELFGVGGARGKAMQFSASLFTFSIIMLSSYTLVLNCKMNIK